MIDALSSHDIAYVARYYYPYPDKRVSRFEVYVSDLEGKKRVQVSDAKGEEIRSLLWEGNEKVTWHQIRGNRETQYEYDVRTGNLRRAFSGRERSVRRFEDSWNWLLQRADSPQLPLPYHQETSLEGMHRSSGREDIWVQDLGIDGQNHLNPTIMRRDRTHRFRLGYGDYLDFYQAGSGKDWMVSYNISGSAGYSAALYLVDWRKEKLTTISSGMMSYQLSSDEKGWAAMEGMRPLSAWGPEKKVWTCAIWAGPVGGDAGRVTPGLVQATEFRLRPGVMGKAF